MRRFFCFTNLRKKLNLKLLDDLINQLDEESSRCARKRLMLSELGICVDAERALCPLCGASLIVQKTSFHKIVTARHRCLNGWWQSTENTHEMLYNKELVCRAVVLTEKEACSQAVYWHIDLPKTYCFPARKGNSMPANKIVDTSKTGGLSFFKYNMSKYLSPIYVIRLDFAESILRRRLVGFKLVGLEHV